MTTRSIRGVRNLSSRQRHAKKRTLYSGQEGRCTGCGALRASYDLILKHKIHRNKGGSSALSNLHLICHRCNKTGAATPKEVQGDAPQAQE